MRTEILNFNDGAAARAGTNAGGARVQEDRYQWTPASSADSSHLLSDSWVQPPWPLGSMSVLPQGLCTGSWLYLEYFFTIPVTAGVGINAPLLLATSSYVNVPFLNKVHPDHCFGNS